MSYPLGYEWLKEHYQLRVLPHSVRSYTGGLLGTKASQIQRHQVFEQNFPESARADDSTCAHLLFALKHEGVNPAYLKSVFAQEGVSEQVAAHIRQRPNSQWSRRLWFWYEWLTGQLLPLPDCKAVKYEPVLNDSQYFTARPENVRRYCLRNNLPGHAGFLPLVRKIEPLQGVSDDSLQQCLHRVLGDYDETVFARAARFLTTYETRTSSEIESENITPDKYIRFGRALELAGGTPLTKKRLIEIQNIIKDSHQQEPDYRVEQNYIGGPGPQGVALTPPRPENIEDLMDDWFAMVERLNDSEIPASVRAGILSASFVYLHPFMDGNGRISRYLIQDVLAKSGLLQPGILLPVSGGILNRQQTYYQTLDYLSRLICDQTDFYIDEAGQITIAGETDHLFRYLDLTHYCQWLCDVIQDVAENLLPKEIDTLVLADKLYSALDQVLDLPAKELRLMVKMILDNDGTLSKRKRKRFEFLTDHDFEKIERICIELCSQKQP
ncbi:Fic family protein [Endozoicomonas gorgoniicola]|uniref:Fic family protein n=1 Tax=Endozoicomonas gorgoniicola TaxID=1234144 RepID=A0ABT3MYP4_9GAMM|nr:Fic family protein [Endozoicomonas gorgoniicola]MCW7554495.1 Fic family protein [Endozoicomonas gorgoniicola]